MKLSYIAFQIMEIKVKLTLKKEVIHKKNLINFAFVTKYLIGQN